MKKTLHIGIHKDLLINFVRIDGAKSVLVDFDGTDEEAIAEIQADPRTIFCSCSCAKNEDGSCAGKEIGDE